MWQRRRSNLTSLHTKDSTFGHSCFLFAFIFNAVWRLYASSHTQCSATPTGLEDVCRLFLFCLEKPQHCNSNISSKTTGVNSSQVDNMGLDYTRNNSELGLCAFSKGYVGLQGSPGAGREDFTLRTHRLLKDKRKKKKKRKPNVLSYFTKIERKGIIFKQQIVS